MATTNEGSRLGDAGKAEGEASDQGNDRDEDEASEYEEREYESSEYSENRDEEVWDPDNGTEEVWDPDHGTEEVWDPDHGTEEVWDPDHGTDDDAVEHNDDRDDEASGQGENRDGEASGQGENRDGEASGQGENRDGEVSEESLNRDGEASEQGENRDGEASGQGENRDGEASGQGENRDGEASEQGENRDGEVSEESLNRDGEASEQGENRDGEASGQGENRDGEASGQGENRDGEASEQGENRDGEVSEESLNRDGEASGQGENRDGEASGQGENRDGEASGQGENRDGEASGQGENRDGEASGQGENRDGEASGQGENRGGEALEQGENRDGEASEQGENRDREASEEGANRDGEALGQGENRDGDASGQGENRDGDASGQSENRDEGASEQGENRDEENSVQDANRDQGSEQDANRDEGSEDRRASQEAASERGDSRATGNDAADSEKRATGNNAAGSGKRATGNNAADSEKRASLKCPLCLDYFTQPKLLPCSHTFCLMCLENMEGHFSKEEPTFLCPHCRSEITIPPGGMAGFQNNFYIRNEDLEAARHGIYCLTHPKQAVDLYCEDCQQAMCVKCVLTKHRLHTIEELSDVAKQAKRQLRELEKRTQEDACLFKQLVEEEQAEEQALKDKRAEVETTILNRHATVVAMADKLKDQLLTSLEESCSGVQSEVSKGLRFRTSLMNDLIAGQELIQRTITKKSMYSQVTTAKELCEGGGNTDCVSRKSVHRSTITRPVLHFTSSLDTVLQKVTDFFGTLDMVEMAVSPPEVTVMEKFRCGEEPDTEVYSLCPLDTDKVWVSYETCGLLKNVLGNCFHKNGAHRYASRYSGKTSRKCSGTECLCLPPVDDETCTYAKSIDSDGSHLELLRYRKGKSTIRKEVKVSNDVKSNKTIFSINAGPHRAFDIDSTRQFFVVVEEPQEPDHHRKVKLFLPNKPDPVASYTSPSKPFNPADVCFFFLGGREVLTIADEVGDSIHVVKVQKGAMTFLRYLAPGCSLLLQPTALNTDLEGQLWVACRGGKVLTMSPITT